MLDQYIWLARMNGGPAYMVGKDEWWTSVYGQSG